MKVKKGRGVEEQPLSVGGLPHSEVEGGGSCEEMVTSAEEEDNNDESSAGDDGDGDYVDDEFEIQAGRSNVD